MVKTEDSEIRDSRLVCTVDEVQGAEVRLEGNRRLIYVLKTHFHFPTVDSESRFEAQNVLSYLPVRSEVRFGCRQPFELNCHVLLRRNWNQLG
jgi:hypothetical protein